MARSFSFAILSSFIVITKHQQPGTKMYEVVTKLFWVAFLALTALGPGRVFHLLA